MKIGDIFIIIIITQEVLIQFNLLIALDIVNFSKMIQLYLDKEVHLTVAVDR